MSTTLIPSQHSHIGLASRRITSLLTMLIIGGVLSGGTGCKLLLPFTPEPDATEAQNLSQPSQGKYVIEVRRQGAKPESTTGELYGQETVSTALAAAGITKKRGAWDIELMRTNPQNGQRHRMFIEYDAADRKVRIEQDYALFPNDHLVVKQATENPFDELFGNFMGE